jgi:deoxyribose-phosphate aldolase
MELAKYIEHTLLSPTATSAQIQQLCEEAIEHKFAGVCVPPFYLRQAANILESTPVRIVTVVGFPMGYSAIAAKIEEIKRAVDEGVQELDIVANICAVKDNRWGHVQNDLDSAIRAAHLHGKTAKIIIEAGLLTTAEISKITSMVVELGANYVKTSTGFHNAPATLAHIQTIKAAANGQIKIKASGGIKTQEQAIQFINAGASRIGTSASLEMIKANTKATK